jgi:hypothetical protein
MSSSSMFEFLEVLKVSLELDVIPHGNHLPKYKKMKQHANCASFPNLFPHANVFSGIQLISYWVSIQPIYILVDFLN